MAKGSGSVEKDLNIIVSIIKNNSRYNVDTIVKDITNLQEKLTGLRKLVDTTINIKIQGVNDIKAVSNALGSMSRILGNGSNGIAQKINKTFEAINNGMAKVGDATNLIKLQKSLADLITTFQSFNLNALKGNFTSFVKLIEKLSSEMEASIKPLDKMTGSFDKLDKKIESSLSNLKQYSDLISFINQAASGAAQNFGGAKVPVFKSKESEVIGLIAQFDKLNTSITKSSEVINKFNSLPSNKIDRGLEKQAASEAKKIERTYLSLAEVISKLSLEYNVLSSSENINGDIMKKLEGILSGLTSKQIEYNNILAKSKNAAREVENAERARRDAYNEQFQSLKGVISRQIEFVTSAAILAGAAETVRLGFNNILNTLNETGRILVVSRSQFLSLADTAILIGQTIDEASVRTGSSVKEIGTILKEFGSAGLTTEQSVAALDSTLANIIGTESSVVETTRLVASTFNILGNSVTGTGDQIANFTRINDIFARATNESSLEMDQLVQSLKFSITAANESGLNLEELTGILGQLADQGLRGGNAGRALRASLQQLSKDASLVAKALNIQIDLSKPLDLLDVIKQYSEQIKGQELSVEELGAVFERFGLRGADVFLLLAQNFDKVEKKIKDLTENSQDAAFIAQDLKLETPERQIAIFQENLARLVKSAIEPLVKAGLVLIKMFNSFADTIRLITESNIPKMILSIGLFTLGLKGLLNMLIFITPALSFFSSTGISLIKTFAEMKNNIAAATGVVAKSTQAFKSLSVIISSLTPYILAISVAFLAVYYIIERVVNANKILRKEINETIKEYQRNIIENKNLANSYDDVAKRIIEAADSLKKGNISQEEYSNELNNISQLSDEVADKIAQYGDNAELAAEKFKLLAQEQRDIVELNKQLIKQESVKKFGIDSKEAELVGEKLGKLNERIKITQDLIKNNGTIGEFSFGLDLAVLEKLKNDTEKDAKELIKSLSEFAQNTVDATLKNAATASARALQQILNPGTIAGLGTSVNKFVDVIDIAKFKINDFNLNKIKTELSEFKNILGDSTQGFEALQRDYAFKFRIIIPDSEIDAIKKAFDNIPAEAITRQANERIVNSFNFKGLAQIFKEDFQKNLGIGLDLSSFEKQIADVMNFDNNKDQIEGLNKIFDGLVSKRFEEISLIKDQDVKTKKINELYQSSIKFKTRLLDIENDNVARQDLLTKAGILQLEQDTLKGFIIDKNNKALAEARTIRRDIIKSDEYELSLNRQNLRLINEALKDSKFQKDITSLDTKDQQLLLDLIQRKVTATKDVATANEKLKQDNDNIRRNLEESELSLENQARLGLTIADQSYRDLKNIKLKKKFLDEQKKDGLNSKIIQTEINKLTEKELEIERTVLISKRDSLLKLTRTKQEFEEYIDLNNTQLKQQNEIVQKYQELLFIQNDLNNASEKKLNNEQLIYDLLQKSSDAQVFILNKARELARYETKQYENAEKLLNVREKYNKETEKIFQENVDNISDPLTKVLNSFFEDGNFGSTLAFVKSIGGGFEDVNKYLDDSNKAVSDFLKFVKQGKIDISIYPEKIQEIAKAYKEANDELLTAKQAQNDINNQKFNLLEKNFRIAIERGGQEGFDRATNILANLTDLTTIIDPETGRIDKSRSEILLSRVLELQKELDNYDFEKNVDPLNQSLAVAVTNADLLSKALQQIAIDLKNLNAAGIDAFSQNKAFNISINGSSGIGSGDSPVRRSSGGFIPGSGSGDIVPAMLEPGEFVIPKKIVSQKGADFFYNLIGGVPQKGYALGGIVRGYQSGGIVDPGDRIQSGESSFLILEALSKVNDNLEFLYNLSRSIGENYNKVLKDSIGPNISNMRGVLSEVKDDTGDMVITLKNILVSLSSEYRAAVENKNERPVTQEEVNNLLKDLDITVKQQELETALKKVETEIQKIDSQLTSINNSNSVQFFNSGGFVGGSGSGDIVPAMLEPGEFVIPKKIVEEKGLEYFYNLIGGIPMKGYALGGIVRGYKLGGNVESLSPVYAGGNSITSDRAFEGLDKLDDAAIKIDRLNQILKENNISINELSKIIMQSIEAYNNQRSIKLKDVQEENKTTTLRNNAVDEILAGTANKDIKKSFDNLASEYLPLYDKLTKTILGLGNVYRGYKKNVIDAGKATGNFFLQASAKSAEKFLNKIEQIGDSFKDLFTKELPGFLSFFLNDIIGANARILSNYQKTKNEIVKEYKNQRADLIEQLKRNEISYFDFFDKLEDLQDDQRKKEIEAEEAKNNQIQDQLSAVFTEISRKIASISDNIFGTIGDAIGGLPALLNPVLDSINKLGTSLASSFGSFGGAVGGIIGGLTGIGGQIAGVALGAAGQFFSAVAQGFSQLLPVVTSLLLMNDIEFEGFIESVSSLPDELTNNIEKLKDRIPKIVDAFVDGKIIENVAISIANAVSSVFPEISLGFARIMISSLNSVGPIISGILDAVPTFMVSVITSSVDVINFIIDFIGSGLIEVFNVFEDNLKDISIILVDSIKEGLLNIFGDPEAVRQGFTDFFTDALNNLSSSLDTSLIGNIFENIFKDITIFIQNIDIEKTIENVFGILVQGGVFANKIYQFIIDSVNQVSDKIPELITKFSKSVIDNIGFIVSNFVESLADASSVIDFSSTVSNIISEITMMIPSLLIQLTANFIPTFIDAILKSISPENLAKFVTGFYDSFYEAAKEYIYGQFIFGPIIESIFGPLIDIFVGSYFQGFVNAVGELTDLFDALIFSFKTINDIISNTFRNQLTEIIALFNKITKNEKFVLIFNKVNNALNNASKILTDIFSTLLNANIDALADVIIIFTQQLIIIFDLLEASGALGILIDYLDLLIIVMDELYPILEPVINFLLPGLTAALVILTLTAFAPLLAILIITTTILYGLIAVMELLEPIIILLNPLFIILADIFERIEPVLRILAFILFTGLLAILIAINAPLVITIALIIALASALALFEVIRPELEQFGQVLLGFAGLIRTAGENAAEEFENFINDLINRIPTPAGATNSGGSNSGGNPFSKFRPPPGFSTGGFVRGTPGHDKISAKLTSGEYVIRKNIVEKYGQEFFDFLNTGGNDSTALTFGEYGIAYDKGLIYNKPNQADKYNEYNANTRDYYLDNYLRDNGSSLSTSSNISNSNSPSNDYGFYSPFMAVSDFGELTGSVNNNDNVAIQPAGSNIERNSSDNELTNKAGDIKVEFKFELDMRGSNFSGDNIANEIDSKLAERMLDNKSSISRVVKEMIEEAKVK